MEDSCSPGYVLLTELPTVSSAAACFSPSVADSLAKATARIAAEVGMAAPFELLPNPEMRSYWALDVNLKIHWRNPKFMCIDRPSKNKSEK